MEIDRPLPLPLSFTVEVDHGAEPLTGVVRTADDEIRFVGWVAFAGALERVLDGEPGAGEEGR